MINNDSFNSKKRKRSNNYFESAIKSDSASTKIKKGSSSSLSFAPQKVSPDDNARDSAFAKISTKKSPVRDFMKGDIVVQSDVQKPLLDSHISARFILDELLGTGGVCEVFKARDLRRVEWGDINPHVAIKRLIPELTDNAHAQSCLIQEFCTVRNLNHPGIIRFFDIHKEPWGMCCSMELLQGISLKDYIIDRPLGKSKFTYNIILNLLDAIEFIHSKNIAHGDIKPANIFIEANDKIVLFDFNVAYVDDKGGDSSALTKRIFQAKNPHAHCSSYSSPEQVTTGIVSINADIFSVACCIYQLFQGSHPFNNIAPKSSVDYDIFPERPYNMSYFQWYIIKLALNHNPNKRPSATAIIKCFKQPFGSFFIIAYFCKNILEDVNNIASQNFTKLKIKLNKRFKKD